MYLLFYLGEVLEALLELECLDILEDTKPKVDVYIKKKEAGDLVAMSNFANCENFFSIIKTLAVALGNQDPCRDVHKYANGLKNKKNTEVSTYLLNFSIFFFNSSILFQLYRGHILYFFQIIFVNICRYPMKFENIQDL